MRGNSGSDNSPYQIAKLRACGRPPRPHANPSPAQGRKRAFGLPMQAWAYVLLFAQHNFNCLTELVVGFGVAHNGVGIKVQIDLDRRF